MTAPFRTELFLLQEGAMRVLPALSAMVLLLVGCESTKAPDARAELRAPHKRCDTVLTGSRIPQCNRGDVQIITREELERDGFAIRGSPVPPNAGL